MGGTDFGLTVYDGTTPVSYTDEDGLGDNRINHINEDSNGWIWVGEKDGLSVFDGEAWTAFTTADGLPLEVLITLLLIRMAING